MERLAWVVASFSVLSVAACDGTKSSAVAPPPDAGVEVKELCPDPADPRVHYREQDTNRCAGVVLDCTSDQNGFNNICGCGCIEKGNDACPPIVDPAITWISRDPSACPASPPNCPSGDLPFSTACGCGCIRQGG